MSLVTNGMLNRGISEKDIVQYLSTVARLVNLYCRAENERKRFRARAQAPRTVQERYSLV
jgi:hypothetical protein